MTVQISKIDIRNFRSARTLIISPRRLAILVGKNDAGKSNVLRALNLFFNDHTDLGESLQFDIDHNVFNQPNRQAKELSIRLEIELPEAYHATNGDFIDWEKRWRHAGLVHNSYEGRRRVIGQRGGIRIDPVSIPERSNVHALLRNISFVYVPAIKDLEYFSELRASIYNVIAEVADRTFRDSSRDFEKSISTQLNDLTTEITKSLGLQSRLALPRDLSHIFESLDFLSEAQNISLDVRGDGIKARHIPLILKFMADRKRSLQARGVRPHSFIWGYEEPENNLELTSSVELADQFCSFLDDGISQIFLTTHSPIFYNLHNKEGAASQVSCHHIFRDLEQEGTKEAQEPSDLDERMGTMKLFAPLVEDLENRVRESEVARIRAEELAQANRRKLFVEGPSDRDVLKKALEVFAPEHFTEIDIETKVSGGGFKYVIDMLAAWANVARHHPGTRKAAGLVDLDSAARKAADEWNNDSRNIQYAKCIKLQAPVHMHPVLNAGFRIPIVLETLYDREAWEWADNQGHLKERNALSIVPDELGNRILGGETTLPENLESEWAIYVKREFRQEGKGPMARHFAQKSSADFRNRLPILEKIVNEIVAYLFPNTEAENRLAGGED